MLPPLFLCVQRWNNLFLNDGFGRAAGNAGTAVDAFVFRHSGFTIFHSDGFHGAGSNASFASDAFFQIDFSSHFTFLLFMFFPV
jgi:hypothetical protein